MQYVYRASGTCARQIIIDLQDDTVQNIKFNGGCHGSLQGICALAVGQKATTVIDRLKNIRCESRPTSCPDQLAQALSQALATKSKQQTV